MAELPQITNPGSLSDSGGKISSPAGAAADIEKIGDGGAQLQWMAHMAIKDEEVARIQGGIADYTLAEAKVRDSASTITNADDWFNNVSQGLTQAQNSVLAAQAPGPVRDKLAAELKLHMADDLVKATGQAVDMRIKNSTDTTQASAAKEVLAAVNASDPADRDYHFHQLMGTPATADKPAVAGLIDGNSYFNAGEKAQLTQKYMTQIDEMGLQADITRDPGLVAKLRDPKFLETVSPYTHVPYGQNVTFQQARQISDEAAKQLTQAATAIEDARKNEWAKTYNDLLANKNSPGFDSRVTNAWVTRQMPKEWAEALVHHPLEAGSDGASVNSVDSDINQISTPLDVELAKDKIRTMMVPDSDGFPLLSRADGMKRLDKLDAKAKVMEQDTKGFEAKSMNILRSTYTPFKLMSIMTPSGPPSFEGVVDDFKDNLQHQLNLPGPTKVSGWQSYQNALDATQARFIKSTVSSGANKGSIQNMLKKGPTASAPPPAGSFESTPAYADWKKRVESKGGPVDTRALAAVGGAASSAASAVGKSAVSAAEGIATALPDIKPGKPAASIKDYIEGKATEDLKNREGYTPENPNPAGTPEPVK